MGKLSAIGPGRSARLQGRCLSGCAAVALTLPAAGLVPSALRAQDILLDGIVLTATGFEQNIADAPASISVITAEDLERGAFRDLTDALREVQGVTATGVANERDIQIRGLPGAYTLILVDGRRQGTRESRPNGSAGYEQSFIPPLSAIERIEVVRGPMSSLYGSDAMGGVINIITRKADSVWSGSVTVEGTAQDSSRYGDSGQLSFNIGGPLVKDRLSLQLWGRALDRAEDYRLGGIQGSEETNIAGRLVFTPTEDHEFRLEAGRTEIETETSAGRTLAATAADSGRDLSQEYWSIGHSGTWGNAKTDLSFQQERGTRESYSYDAGLDSMVRNDRVPRVKNSVLEGKLTLPLSLRGEHTLVTGFQHQSAEVTDRGHTAVDQKLGVDQWALFAEDEWKITDSFALTGGLRYDHHESYGGHISPRLYAVWHGTEQLTLKGGVSTGFRAPDVRQVAEGYYLPTQQGAGLIAANPDLEPEESTSFELSALWDNQSNLTLGATAFHTDFRKKLSNMNTGTLIDPDTGDVIDPLGGAACNAAALGPYPGYSCLWRSFNIDDAVIRGIELTASWEATPDIRLRGSYTYTDSEQKTGSYAGFPLTRTPEHLASLRLDWSTPHDPLDLWATATYHGSEINAGARIGSNGSPVTINGQAGRKYAAYSTLDIGGSYEVTDRVTLNSAIYNLTDRRVEAADSNTVAEGRRLWVGVTTSF
ncbi:TonB-dependent receptor [Cereibacter changlensis JA139]|uniref:TonB-dependent receptor n=2 Tax=Cereibacter changlensis TaxID=402884 RepID=A0A2T4JT20_9RHOB|nr:TonB-dependent receptor [Cereibacter changlensis]PTE21060.1 TonB-dependent receptor [Cereibacter changlensis JA139]PZX56264.1 outer membrane receptor for ferrienterochelin and colicins [Cereibacter changlensis]